MFVTSEWVLARSVVAAESKIALTWFRPRTDSDSTWWKRSWKSPAAIWLDRKPPAASSASAVSSTAEVTVRKSSDRLQRESTAALARLIASRVRRMNDRTPDVGVFRCRFRCGGCADGALARHLLAQT